MSQSNKPDIADSLGSASSALEEQYHGESSMTSRNPSISGPSDPGKPTQVHPQAPLPLFVPSFPTAYHSAPTHQRVPPNPYQAMSGYKCAVQTCERATSGFPRKADLESHMTTVHALQPSQDHLPWVSRRRQSSRTNVSRRRPVNTTGSVTTTGSASMRVLAGPKPNATPGHVTTCGGGSHHPSAVSTLVQSGPSFTSQPNDRLLIWTAEQLKREKAGTAALTQELELARTQLETLTQEYAGRELKAYQDGYTEGYRQGQDEGLGGQTRMTTDDI